MLYILLVLIWNVFNNKISRNLLYKDSIFYSYYVYEKVLFIEKRFVELMFFFICVFKMGIIRSFFFL